MVKIIFDKFLSIIILFLFLPILLIIIFIVFISDFSNPFYISERVGKNFKNFKLIKIRSMVTNAELSGITSTSANDKRITPIGLFIRRYKIDEIVQLVNVLLGDMSLVGPRPQIPSEVKLYNEFEKNLLKIRPGITDFSSIIFSDEGEILKFSKKPNEDYNILIRPWKSRLGVFYVNKNSLFIDILLIFLTIISIFNRKTALKYTSKLLSTLNAEHDLIEVAKRNKDLKKN
jgi:lipopolysaccharide/colanic/teichoic acid biosynthesis glycosyltransferase